MAEHFYIKVGARWQCRRGHTARLSLLPREPDARTIHNKPIRDQRRVRTKHPHSDRVRRAQHASEDPIRNSSCYGQRLYTTSRARVVAYAREQPVNLTESRRRLKSNALGGRNAAPRALDLLAFLHQPALNSKHAPVAPIRERRFTAPVPVAHKTFRLVIIRHGSMAKIQRLYGRFRRQWIG